MNAAPGNRHWTSAAQIYNSAVAAWTIGAAWELGVLDELNQTGAVDADDFAARHRLDVPSTRGMFRALSAVSIVERDGTKVVPGPIFAEVYQTRSFFHWLTRGSAELFRRMPEILQQENRVGDFYQRDSAAIAFACREMSTFCYDPWFWSALDEFDFDLRCVADLGCGGGDRLISILRRYPAVRGVGIDIATDALEVAETRAEASGLRDRLTLVADNMLKMRPRPAFAEVDLLTCFMAGHDFWPRERCVNTLARLRELFPNVRRFLIGDATRTADVPDQELPVFTLGFELGHELMGAYIPTVAEWESTFEAGGWRLHRKHSINLVVGEVIFELEGL